MLLVRRRWALTAAVFLGAALGGSARGIDLPDPTPQPAPPCATQCSAGETPLGPPSSPPPPAPPSGCVNTPPESTPGRAGESPSIWQRRQASLQDCFLGYPDEFEAPPLGHFLYLHGQTMVANREAARLVLYDYDFVENSARLSPRGRRQLANMVPLLAGTMAPVVIEEIPDALALNAGRRAAVLDEVARQGWPVPAERVVIGPPPLSGLSGVEAEIVYRNLLIQTQYRAAVGLAGGSASGATAVQGSNGSARPLSPTSP